MNHYPKHVGDYIRDTVSLTMLEDGAFNRLLDQYYATEKPLPLDGDELYRMARANNPAERKAVDYVVAKFFKETADGYHNSRADSEIVAYQARADKARENGAKGGRHGKRNGTQKEPAGLPLGSPEGIPDGTGGEASQNQNQLIAEPNGSGASATPHSEIVALYHETLPELPRVREWTEKRKRMLQARWRSEPKRQSLAWWQKFFAYVRQSDFLCGRAAPSPGRSTPFLADLEWLLTEGNFVSVIEGKYHEAEKEAA